MRWLNARLDRWAASTSQPSISGVPPEVSTAKDAVEIKMFYKILEYAYLTLWKSIEWARYTSPDQSDLAAAENVCLTSFIRLL
jgi:hypothetical protein